MTRDIRTLFIRTLFLNSRYFLFFVKNIMQADVHGLIKPVETSTSCTGERGVGGDGGGGRNCTFVSWIVKIYPASKGGFQLQ